MGLAFGSLHPVRCQAQWSNERLNLSSRRALTEPSPTRE